VEVVQYTFTHKQYIEQHNSLIRKSADRAPPVRGVPWHLPYNGGKSTEKPHVKYPLFLSDFNETRSFSIDFRKILKYQIKWKSVFWKPSSSGRTDGQTWS